MPPSDDSKNSVGVNEPTNLPTHRLFHRWHVLAIALGFAVISSQTTLFWGIRHWITQKYQCAFERGFIECEFQDADGNSCRYTVFVPYSWRPGVKLPLMLYLNGRGKNGDDGLAPLIDGIAPAIWERRGNFPYFVVWPQCPEGDSWTASSLATRRALAILEQTADCFGTDPDKRYLSGLSSGGRGVWAIAAENQDMFAAIVPISSSGVSDTEVRKIADAGIPVWSFSIADDGQHVVTSNRSVHERLLALGQSPRHTELETDNKGRMDAHDAWSFAYRNAALHDWLMKQNRLNRDGRYQQILPDDNIVERGISSIHCEFRAIGDVAALNVSLPVKGTEVFQRVRIAISLDRMKRGGLYGAFEQQSIQDSWLPAECSFLSGIWNDLRIRSGPDGVTAELNGWPLFDNVRTPERSAQLPNDTGAASHEIPEGEIFFEAMGPESATVEIRNLRGLSSEVLKNELLHDPSKAAVAIIRCHDRPEKDQGSGEHVLQTLRRAWKSTRRQTRDFLCSWGPSRNGFHAGSAFQAASSVNVLDSDRSSHLNLSTDGYSYTGPWTHQRRDMLRGTGLSGDTTYTEFLTVLQSHFRGSQTAPPKSIRLDIQGPLVGREDRLMHANGSGDLAVYYPPDNLVGDLGLRNGVDRGNRFGSLDDLYWLAPILASRPDSLVNWSGEFQIVSDDGASAQPIQIEQRNQIGGRTLRTKISATEASEYLPLRVGFADEKNTREIIDFHYAGAPSRSNKLHGWDSVVFPGVASSVSDCYFPGNDRLFQFVSVRDVQWKPSDTSTPPKGLTSCLVVQDLRTQTWYRLRDDGSRHLLTPDEITQVILGDQEVSPRPWIAISVVTVIGVLFVFSWFIKRRLFRSKSNR